MILWLALGGIAVLGFSQKEALAAKVITSDPSFTKYDALFQKYGNQYGVPWRWLKAICMNESSLGKDRRVAAGDVSSDGKSWGIMQLTLATAADFEPSSVAKLNDPDYSVRVAAKFVAWLMKRFDKGSPNFREYVVKSYNQGAGNTNKEIALRKSNPERFTGSTVPFAEAAEYWRRFLRNSDIIASKQGE